MFVDYYEILEIPPTATLKEIKRNFYKLALLWHPDKNHSPLAHDKFIKIYEAYHILSNEDMRKQYDIEYVLYKKASFSDISDFSFKTRQDVNDTTQSAVSNAEKAAQMRYEEYEHSLSQIMKNVRDTAKSGIKDFISVLFFLEGIRLIISGIYYISIIKILVGILLLAILTTFTIFRK